MRRYMDIVAGYIAEAIIGQLEPVPLPANHSHEIGGRAVNNTMTDILPHHSVWQRNQPQAYSEIFARATGDTHNDQFDREPAPVPHKLQQRRNNNAGIKKLTPVSAKGDADALLHSDFASNRASSQPIIPGFRLNQRHF